MNIKTVNMEKMQDINSNITDVQGQINKIELNNKERLQNMNKNIMDLQEQISKLEAQRDEELKEFIEPYTKKIRNIKYIFETIAKKKQVPFSYALNSETEFLQYTGLTAQNVSEAAVYFAPTKYDWTKKTYVKTGKNLTVEKSLFTLSDRYLASIARKNIRVSKSEQLSKAQTEAKNDFDSIKKKMKILQKALDESERSLNIASKRLDKQIAKNTNIKIHYFERKNKNKTSKN